MADLQELERTRQEGAGDQRGEHGSRLLYDVPSTDRYAEPGRTDSGHGDARRGKGGYQRRAGE